MIVVVSKLDGSSRFTVTEVERIEERDEPGHPFDGHAALITEHSEPIFIDHSTETIDIVGLG